MDITMIGLRACRKIFVSHATFPNRFIRWDHRGASGSQHGYPDEISRKQKLAAAEKWFRGRPYFFWDFREYIGQRARAGELQGGHKPGGRGPPWPRPKGLWAPYGPTALALKPPDLLLFWKNLFRGFYSVWTPFQNQMWKESKTQKNTNWHLALN